MSLIVLFNDIRDNLVEFSAIFLERDWKDQEVSVGQIHGVDPEAPGHHCSNVPYICDLQVPYPYSTPLLLLQLLNQNTPEEYKKIRSLLVIYHTTLFNLFC